MELDPLDQLLSQVSEASEDNETEPTALLDEVREEINRMIAAACTPREAMMLIPDITYREGYQTNQHLLGLPTAMNIELACKKRSRDLGGDGRFKSEWFSSQSE
jgi:hypothetical protein